MLELNREELKARILIKTQSTKNDLEDVEKLLKAHPIENNARQDFIETRRVLENNYRQLKLRLIKLEMALSGIDKKSFGVCARCGNPIPEKLLYETPEETLCPICL